MSLATVAPGAGTRDRAFGVLAAATLGLALLETACLLLQAAAPVHVYSTSVGGIFIWFAFRRFLRYWPARTQAAAKLRHGSRAQIPSAVRVTLFAFIGGAGYITANLLTAGFVTPFMLFAFGIGFMPWQRIALTRGHCLGCWTVGAIGIGTALFFGYPVLNPVLLLFVAWVSGMFAIMAWGLTMRDEKRWQRQAAGRPEPDLQGAQGNLDCDPGHQRGHHRHLPASPQERPVR
jgi:hypothetical protein